MADVRVLLRDTQTGREAWHAYTVEPQYVETQEFWWTDGNAACDCNRLNFLLLELGEPDADSPCGDGRVVIVQATIDGVEQHWGDA